MGEKGAGGVRLTEEMKETARELERRIDNRDVGPRQYVEDLARRIRDWVEVLEEREK